MWQFEHSVMVEWGDCDEAGVVFYPRYFYWFDASYQAWLRSLNLSQRTLRQRFGVITPLVDVGATFLSPATYDEQIVVRLKMQTWTTRRFQLLYEVLKAEQLIVSGHEWRAWASPLPDGGLKGSEAPAQLQALLMPPTNA